MSLKANLIFWGIALVLLVPMSIGIVKYQKLKKSGKMIIKQRLFFHKAYVFCYNNIMLRKRFRRIVSSMSSLMCYDMDGLKENSVKLFAKSGAVAVLMPIAGIILYKDVMLSLLIALVGYIFYDMTVDKAIDKQYRKMTEGLVYAIQSISDTYAVTESIPNAIVNCERNAHLERPIQKIYEVVSAEDGYNELMELKRQNPIRLLGALATTCYICNEEGDVRDGEGKSSFIEALTTLRREADSSLRDMTKTNIAFKSLGKIAMVGIVLVPIVDWFLIKQMPGTAMYVNGLYGKTVKTLIILATLVTYYLISVLTRNAVVNESDKIEMINILGKVPKVKRIVEELKPKKFKTKISLQKQINGAISSMDENYVYTMKMTVSLIFFVAAFILCVIFTITSKASIWSYYGSFTLVSTSAAEMTEEQFEQIKEVDLMYMQAKEQMPYEEVRALLKQKVKRISDLAIEEEIERMETKRAIYESLGFKWFYVVIAYVFGIIGWFSPEMVLALRKELVQFESTQDVMQLQTIMLVLSNTKMDVYKVLQWLMTESTVHKAPLRYAMIEYSSDPDDALNRLQMSVDNRDLKRIISKLKKAVEDLSISEAFKDISIDKQQSLVINELLQDEARESKKNTAKMMATIPAALTVFGEFILPIVFLGVKQIMEAFTTMGNV